MNKTFSGISATKKQLLLVCLLAMTLLSCLGPKKVNKWVYQEYGESMSSRPTQQNDFLSIKSTLAAVDDNPSFTENKTSHMLPLVFYWQYEYANICTLNPQIPIDNFTQTVMSYAHEKGLKNSLNGQQLELTVDSIPNVLSIDDKGHIIFLVVRSMSWDFLHIIPENKNMVVSYRLLKDGIETKKGLITIPDINEKVGVKIFEPVKKATLKYLDQYNNNISLMSKRVLDNIITEL